MKRVITVLLAALLVLSLVACGSGVETKKLAGTWTCTVDVTDRMNAAAEQALGLSAADGAAKMPLQLVLTVTEDGAYTLRYDSDAARTALDAYAAALRRRRWRASMPPRRSRASPVRNTTRPWRRPASPWTIWWRPFSPGWTRRSCSPCSPAAAPRSPAIAGAEGGQLYLADTAADLTETADCLNYTLSDGTMTWTDAQGELSSQLTEQEQELLRVPLTWTKRAEESK